MVLKYNMDGFFESDLEKAGTSKQDTKGEKVNSQEKGDTKPRHQYVTEEMLQKCWKMSVEEGQFKKQYEEAAYMVYGTVPPGKTSSEMEAKKNKDQKH